MGSNASQNNNINNYNKNIKSDYFTTIKKILRNNYEQCFDENRIKNNMLICLEKKSFKEIYDENEIINTPYINWLDYLYTYLSTERNKKEWASEMLQKLDEEQFLEENKYLSQFFFKEFYINTEPDCIKESKDDDSNNDSDDFINNSNDLKISLGNSNLNMMRNLGGTFGPNSPQAQSEMIENDGDASSSHENEPEKKYKSFRKQVKKYIYIFKTHIVYKDHPINRVIQIFEQTWVKYVEKKISFLDNFDDADNDYSNTNEMIDELTRELQNFIIKIQNCLKLFYCRAIDYSCFNNEKDELINLLTTLIFRTGNIYKTIFNLQKIKLRPIISDMEKKYFQLKKITPQVLGIEKQFCLNIETLNLQEDILEKENLKFNENNNKNLNDKNEEKKNNDDLINLNENLDLEYKGTGNIFIDITDETMEKRKISNLLLKIKQKKTIISKNKGHEMDDIKVEIDFGHDNNNILSESYFNKPGSLYEENNVGSILPKSRASMINDNEINIMGRNTTNNKNSEIFLAGNINDESEENDNCLIIRDNTDGRKTITPINFIKVFDRVSFRKDPIKTEFSYFPYETAIQLLKQIEKYKAPFEKMLIFASLGNEIKNCIDDFWKEMEDYIKNDLLGVEAEQLMTIFIYIISKAQIKDILVHCKLIQLFTTTLTKSSMIGYYYSNAEASVTFIQTLKDVKELFKGKAGVFDNNNSENSFDMIIDE